MRERDLACSPHDLKELLDLTVQGVPNIEIDAEAHNLWLGAISGSARMRDSCPAGSTSFCVTPDDFLCNFLHLSGLQG